LKLLVSRLGVLIKNSLCRSPTQEDQHLLFSGSVWVSALL